MSSANVTVLWDVTICTLLDDNSTAQGPAACIFRYQNYSKLEGITSFTTIQFVLISVM